MVKGGKGRLTIGTSVRAIMVLLNPANTKSTTFSAAMWPAGDKSTYSLADGGNCFLRRLQKSMLVERDDKTRQWSVADAGYRLAAKYTSVTM